MRNTTRFPVASQWTTMAPGFQPERFRALLYQHPASQQVRWFKATPSTDYDRTRGRRTSSDSTLDTTAFDYPEQTVSQYRALISEVSINTIRTAMGKLQQGDLEIVTMPDEIPIGTWDRVIPIGYAAGENRTFRDSETMTRGGLLVKQTGTVVSGGQTITGTGTSFQTAFRVGDIIVANGQAGRITAISSNTSLTVDVAPAPAWTAGLEFSKAVDRLRQYLVTTVESLVDANGVTYTLGTSFSVGADGQSIQWTSATNSPAYGVKYSVVYRVSPCYIIDPSMGQPGPMVRGVGLPQRVYGRLWQPESFTS